MNHVPPSSSDGDDAVSPTGLNRRPRSLLARWSARLGFATAVVALFGAIIQFSNVYAPLNIDRPREHLEATATITSPATTALPEQEVTLAGVHQGLQPDSVLWAVIQDMSTNELHPQNRPCSVEPTTFNCGDVFVGPDRRPTGAQSFTIKIVTVTPSAVNEFMQYNAKKRPGDYPGLTSLPSGTKVIGLKEVTR